MNSNLAEKRFDTEEKEFYRQLTSFFTRLFTELPLIDAAQEDWVLTDLVKARRIASDPSQDTAQQIWWVLGMRHERDHKYDPDYETFKRREVSTLLGELIASSSISQTRAWLIASTPSSNSFATELAIQLKSGAVIHMVVSNGNNPEDTENVRTVITGGQNPKKNNTIFVSDKKASFRFFFPTPNVPVQ